MDFIDPPQKQPIRPFCASCVKRSPYGMEQPDRARQHRNLYDAGLNSRTNDRPENPNSIIAHVDGSGTAEEPAGDP
jgi:hypothetical protein